jgi:hypothetical protein
MTDQQRLKYLYDVARQTGDLRRYYEEVFSSENFERSPLLSKVKVWARVLTFDEETLSPEELIKEFQEFLDLECAKPNFTENANCVPGWKVRFLEGIFDVYFFSSRIGFSSSWMELAYID